MKVEFKTKPHEKLHSVEIPQNLKEILLYFSDGLKDGVNFGTQILGWEVEEGEGGVENVSVWMLLRHILELIDSVSILVEKSSIDPCKPLLRAALESVLQLEYMLVADYENRSKSFIVCNYYDKLNNLFKLKLNTAENLQFIKELSKDKTSPLTHISLDSSAIESEIEMINSILSSADYKKEKKEYEKYKLIKKKNPKWFQLFNGPNNIEQLSNVLKRNGMYQVFYRNWSGSTHGTDILNHISINQDDNLEVLQLRIATDAQVVVTDATNLLFITFQIIQSYRSTIHENEFKIWFTNFTIFFQQLLGKSFIY